MAALTSVNTTIRDEVLVKEVLHALDKKFVLLPWLNTGFEGELKEKGDTVAIQILPNITFSTGTTAGGTITPAAFTITKESLVIDTLKQAGITITDYEQVIVNFDLMAKFADRFAISAKEVIETAAFTVLKSGIASANKLNEASPVTITAANVFGYIETMRVALSSNNAFGESALFVSPSIASFIRQSPIYDGYREGLRVREEGYIMKISGFEVYESNNIGSNHMVGTVRDSVNFCVQFNKYKVVELTNAFAHNVLAEICMGGLVASVNNKASVTLKYA